MSAFSQGKRKAIASFISSLFGKTYEESYAAAQQLRADTGRRNRTAGALEDLAKNYNSAAFDELILSINRKYWRRWLRRRGLEQERPATPGTRNPME